MGVIEVVDILAAGFGPADERAPLRDRLGVDVAAVALKNRLELGVWARYGWIEDLTGIGRET